MPRPAAPAPSRVRRLRRLVTAAVAAGLSAGAAVAAPPEAAVILSTYAPKVVGGTGVDIETPPESQWDQCKTEPVREGSASGYVVTGPQGQVLRRILDADGDDTIELFIYFNQGMEVYREWDSDGAKQNSKGVPVVSSNNFRWVNFGGTKWGVDEDGDRKVDRWRRITAAEAARVAAEAVVAGDAALLSTVLLTAEEMEALGVAPRVRENVAEKLANPAAKLKAMRAESAMLKARPTFQSVNPGQPGLILAGQTARGELEVVENSNALLDVGGGNGLGIISIPEIVRVGDRADTAVWKLSALPETVEGKGQVVLGGPLIQPEGELSGAGGEQLGVDPQVAKLLADLAKLNADRPAQADPKKDHLAHAAKVLKVLRELYKVDKGPERTFWLTTQADKFHELFLNQHIDGDFAQTELKKIRTLAKNETPEALPVVDQRTLFVEWGERRRELGAEPKPDALDAFEEWWASAREDFIKTHEQAGESGTFLIELAMEAEQRGADGGAKDSYRKIVQRFPGSQLASKATGALRRLDLLGKPLTFDVATREGGTISDRDTRGKVTLMTFWNVACEPCRQNLPVLKDLYAKYGADLEIVAVNVDETPNPIAAYVKENGVPFPVAYEPGGFNGPAATRFGVVNLPTMLLADKQGRVVAVNPDIREVQTKVPQLVK